MKKRVRVYQKGGFNAFGAPAMPPLRVAQEGANVQQPQYTDEQLLSVVMSIVGEQGGSPEDAMQQLVSAGVDQNKANQVVSSAIDYINQQRGQGQQQEQPTGQSEEEMAQAQAEAEAQAQQQEEADRQSRYNTEMANDQADLEDSEADIDAFALEHIMRTGGSLPSKRSFVKNVMKLTKKAAGGQGESGKADDTDIPGGRQAGLQAFVGDLKGKANGYLQEQDAKAMYEMMAPVANESDMYGEDPEMQFGGMRPGQQRRLERRANRMAGMVPAGFFNAQQQMFPQGINIMSMPSMPGMMPGMPGMGSRGMQSYQMPSRGLYEGGPRLANIEVHKTGLFGRPKQWTATFDNSRGYDPNQWMRDMARMNQANQQTEYEDVNFDHSEEATNTSTAENAAVAEQEAETQTGGGDGNKPKPDTGEDTNEEVEERSGKKPAGEIPKIDFYEPWKGGMQDLFDSEYNKPYIAYVDSKGNVLPDKKGSVGTKQYYYNSRTNKWSNIDGTIDDKDRLARLNNWKKTERLHPGHVGMESTSERLMNKPQGAQADDAFVTNAVTGALGIPAALRMGLPAMVNLSRYNGQLPPGNNQGLSGPGTPSSVQQALGAGANPRLLGTGEVPNVPTAATSYGMKPTVADMGSNRMFEPESKQVETSKPVKLKIEGESVFKLKSGDTKSHYVNKNGKIYKTSKLGDESQWYEIKDPERVQNIIALSGRNENAFDLSKPKTSTPQHEVSASEKYNKLNTRVQLVRGALKDPNFPKTKMNIPVKEQFSSSYFDRSYKNLTFKNGKLYFGSDVNDWVEVKDPNIVSAVMDEQAALGILPFAYGGVPQQFGGMTDQQSELYRFMGGGEDISIPTLNERNTADPYFAYGGIPQAADGMIAINDASGNRKYVTQDEADAWNSAIKDNEDLSLNDMSWASESPRQNPNYRTWDDLKDKGINVGDYREGIDYSGMGQKSQQTQGSSGYYPPNMYNPAVGAMYPPLFGGGRRFGPAGRTFEYAGSWAKQKGMPFDPRTGQILGQMPTDLPLTKLDVTKSSMFGRRPKEWTATFGNYGQLGDNLPKGTPGAEGAMGSEEKDYSKRNKFAEGLMRTPGLRKLGAKLYKQQDQPLPEGTEYTEEQMPSLPLRGTNNNLASDLVPDQYNNANQPGISNVDMTGLQDSPIPEITPEEFSFEDQQRFGNIQGPLNQEEATGMGSLPMRPLSNIPTQYDDQLMANSFNYSPQGLVNPEAAAELQRFMPESAGPMTEGMYQDQFGFPVNDPNQMRDITGQSIEFNDSNYPYNVEGPMSDMMNDPNQDEFFYNENQNLPTSESNSYYQDVMQPNRDQSMYPMGFPEGITPDEYGQYAQESLDGFDPMRLPSESNSAPEPWMTQDMVNTQTAKIQAAENARRQQEAILRRRREAESQGVIQNQQRNPGQTQRQTQRDQRRNEGPENNPSYAEITPDDNGTIKEAKIANNDLVRRYGAGEFEIEMYDNLLKDPKSNPEQIKSMLKMYPKLKNYKQGTLETERQRAERLIKEANARGNSQQTNPQVRKPSWMRQTGGSSAQTGLFTTNPDLVGLSDIDLLNAQTAPDVTGSVNNATGDWWSSSPNMSTPTIQETGAVQPDQMTIDPNQQYTQQMKREYDPRGASVKFKNKNMYNIDFERGVNQLNAGINAGLGALGEIGDRNKGAQRFNNLNSGIYGSTASRDRGTYETNSGLFRPDEKGFKGIVKKGGSIYKTGGVTYMSADQVKKFLAEGGELEFV